MKKYYPPITRFQTRSELNQFLDDSLGMGTECHDFSEIPDVMDPSVGRQPIEIPTSSDFIWYTSNRGWFLTWYYDTSILSYISHLRPINPDGKTLLMLMGFEDLSDY